MDHLPNWTVRGARLAALGLIFAAAVVGMLKIQEAAQQTLYENQIAGCRRSNPKWRAYTGVVLAARHSSSPIVAAKARSGYRRIIAQPYIRADGTTECLRAIQKP